MGTATRSEKLDLRLTADDKHTLQTAASAVRRSVSEFVLESALARAHETLPDRQAFGLDADRWQSFQAALGAPVQQRPRLRRLLAEPGVFDQSEPE